MASRAPGWMFTKGIDKAAAAAEGEEAKVRAELERLHRPTKPWQCPYFRCQNVSPPHTFSCAGCGKDMLRYTRCRSLIDAKPEPIVCGNRQILLTLKCYKCHRSFVR